MNKQKEELPSWLEEICRKLSKHSNDRKLRFLDLNSKKIGDEGVKALAKALKGSKTKIECLYLYNNNITDEGIIALLEWLQYNTTTAAVTGDSSSSSPNKLQKLYLGKNKITDRSACQFATLFQQQQQQQQQSVETSCDKLQVIDLSYNNISKACSKTIEQSAQQYSSSMVSLYFIGNKHGK